MTDNKNIKIIKELGEEIGYGNLMWIASALWERSLKDNNYPTTGVFRPTLKCLMNEDGQQMSVVDSLMYRKKVNNFYEKNDTLNE